MPSARLNLDGFIQGLTPPDLSVLFASMLLFSDQFLYLAGSYLYLDWECGSVDRVFV